MKILSPSYIAFETSIQPSVSSRSCGANDYLKPLDWYDYMTIKHHYNIRTIILVKTIKKKIKNQIVVSTLVFNDQLISSFIVKDMFMISGSVNPC